MVQYFGNSETNFTTMARAAEKESQTTGLWIDILSTCFKQYELFAVDAEVRHVDNKKSDLLVFYQPDRSSTVIVIECKAKYNADSWDKARRQAFDYIVDSVKKKNNPTIGIVAKGDEFIMFKVRGSNHGQGDPAQETIQVGLDPTTGRPIPKGTPSNVVDQAGALEDFLNQFKADAMRGEYTNQ